MKTRPGGQPDGSSHMGAWGGWALAPDIADGEDLNRSHTYWSRHPARRSKSPFDFFNLPQGRSEARKPGKLTAQRGFSRHLRPICPRPWMVQVVPSPDSQNCYRTRRACPCRKQSEPWAPQPQISPRRHRAGKAHLALARRGKIYDGLRIYGVSTARLTIFSFCSLPSSAATSFLLIALLPNWMRNMPSRAPPMIEAW
jgi:hypothetical protein